MAERWAPGELKLVQGFLNTTDLESGRDDLPSPSALEAWIAERRESLPLHVPRVVVDPEGFRRALDVREALRALARANHGEPFDRRAIATLNVAGERARLGVTFEKDGRAHLHPKAEGVDALIGRILQIVYLATADGTWPRFKVCRKDSCQWVFYDHSKNRSSAWCSMRVCGNRVKAQAYRERHRTPRA